MRTVPRATVLALVVTMTTLGPATAQGPSETPQDPSATPLDPAASPQSRRLDLALEMPLNMGGFEPEVAITRGQEHLANLDPDDPADAATAAQLQSLFEATGVTVQDMTSAYALVSQEDFFSFVVAVRLEGATPGLLLEAYLPILEAGLVDPQTAPTTLGGKDVLRITSEGTAGEPVELYVYEAGDTIWMVQGPLDVVGSVLEDLP